MSEQAQTTTEDAKAGAATAAPATSTPTAEEAAAWEGWRLDDLRGGKTGTVEGVYRDTESGQGVWLGVRMGRFGHRSVLPLAHCVGLAGRVWAPYDRDDIRAAPRVDPGQTLTREDEIYLLEAFGLPTDSGRGAEVSARPANSETSRPA